MQFASRESLATARARLDELIDQTSTAALRTLSDELFAIVGVLARERVLRRHLADPATSQSKRSGLVDTVFGGKVTSTTVDILTGLVVSRWSGGTDLVDAVEALARQAALAVAERDGDLEDVEDELFRFARVLAAQPGLRELLADQRGSVDGRLALVDRLVAGKVRPVTMDLLHQTVRVPRGRSLDAVVERLAELAAARRGRSVAQVAAAVALTEQQEQRLADDLSRIYGRAVSVQVELDPDLLGGLVIRVGDEVIDGSVASRLAAARQQLSW
jgi:F-type H+-transporting ATPase subunit delta